MIDPCHVQDAGCQVSLVDASQTITVMKGVKKLYLPYFDPSKMSCSSFAMKLHASLIECDLSDFLKNLLLLFTMVHIPMN